MSKFSPKKESKSGVSVIIYGYSGVGKTRLLTTHPNIAIVGTEGKPLEWEACSWRDGNNIQYGEIPYPKDDEKNKAKLRDDIDTIVDAMKYCARNKLACGVDSISFWQNMYQMRVVSSVTGSDVRSAWGDVRFATIDVVKHIPDLKERGLDVIITAHVTSAVPEYRMDDYIVARSKETKAERKELLEAEYSILMPYLAGSMKHGLPYWADVTGYMEKKGDVYTISFDCGYAFTKDSNGRLGTIEIDGKNPLTLQRICDTIREN